MKIHYIRSIIVMISVLFISGCVGYAQQPYSNYPAQRFAHPSISPYGGSYNYGGNYGGYAAPRPYMEPGREYRNYGDYRRHDEDHEGGHREGGHEGHHEER